ncbi:TetR family transcriptional regulator [Schumannella sp. 10F1B-5-1]|nr:TetR family transcriptional regulator [Schumannella sp. 10F1B-5-1]
MDAALRLLDEHGLPELTMRRLAGALDVQPSALYWHVENKQTLLAAVADRILAAARPAPGPGLDWRDATRHEVLAVRDALLTYRDGAEVVLSTRALGLGGDDALQRISAALGRGHDATTARRAATALLHLVLGDATLVQQRIQADSLGVTTRTAALDPTGPAADVDTVRTGLELVLDGLAADTDAAVDPAAEAATAPYRPERRA